MDGRRLANIFLLNPRQGLLATWTRGFGVKKTEIRN